MDENIVNRNLEKYKDIIEKIKISAKSIKYINKEERDQILNDKEIIKEIVKFNINILQYVNINIIDRDIILIAIKNNPNALIFANDDMLGDEEIIFEAIKKEPKFLLLSNNKIKLNKDFIIKAIKSNINCYKYINNKFKEDDDILNLIKYNEELIRLYGKPKKDIQKVKVNYDKYISCDHGIYNYITETKLITNSITIQDLIEEKLVYWINGYYKLYINKNAEILNIAEIYSDYRQKKSNKIKYW